MPTLEGVYRKNLYIKIKSWRLLTDFIFDHCRDLIPDDEREGWHSGYGKMISKETAVAIANRLEGLIANGVFERHMIELSIIKMDAYLSEATLKKFIEFSKHSGGFDIY